MPHLPPPGIEWCTERWRRSVRRRSLYTLDEWRAWYMRGARCHCVSHGSPYEYQMVCGDWSTEAFGTAYSVLRCRWCAWSRYRWKCLDDLAWVCDCFPRLIYAFDMLQFRCHLPRRIIFLIRTYVWDTHFADWSHLKGTVLMGAWLSTDWSRLSGRLFEAECLFIEDESQLELDVE